MSAIFGSVISKLIEVINNKSVGILRVSVCMKILRLVKPRKRIKYYQIIFNIQITD